MDHGKDSFQIPFEWDTKIKAKGTQKKKSDMKTIFQNFQGFDHEGNDPFWTVTGDNVTSLILSDYTKVKGRADSRPSPPPSVRLCEQAIVC